MKTDKEKAKEIAGYKPDETPEIPMFQGQDGDKYACYQSAMAMAQYKDKMRQAEPQITITEMGDPSVGIMPNVIATLILDPDCAEGLKNDGTLRQFETELEALLCKYGCNEYHTEASDNIIPINEP